MKIAACLIVKNELNNIEKLVHQLATFCSHIFITDTGSDDGTYELLQRMTAEEPKLNIDSMAWEYDFAKARNHVYERAIDCADYQFWCDGDDLLNDKLLQHLKHFSEIPSSEIGKQTDGINITYQYYNQSFYRVRLTKTSAKHQWLGFIHEILDSGSDEWWPEDECVIQQSYKASVQGYNNRNHEIFIKNDAAGNITTPRDINYYGNEMIRTGSKVIPYLLYQEVILNDRADPLDRINACHRCFMFYGKEKYKFNLDPFHFASILYKQNHKRADLLCDMGDWLLKAGKLTEAVKLYNEAIATGRAQGAYLFLYDDRYHLVYPRLQLGVAYFKMKKYDEFERVEHEALDIEPGNTVALNNIKYFEENIKAKTPDDGKISADYTGVTNSQMPS